MDNWISWFNVSCVGLLNLHMNLVEILFLYGLDFGIFVEIGDTSCEGLIRMADLQDDYYELDKDNYRVVGRSNGRVFNFGDKLQVRVSATNLAKRSIDLELVDNRASRFSARSKPSRSNKSSRSLRMTCG